MNPKLKAAYLWHKQNPFRADGDIRRPAELALAKARADVASGKARYPRGATYSAPGAPFEGYGTRLMRWCESPADIGLRFVGYADKLARIDHRGWFTDSDNSETVRGVVYQLPARDGRPLYVSGACNCAADNGGPATIDFGTIWAGEPGEQYADRDHYGAHRDAAYHADKLAECMAEREREYQAAWQAGLQWAGRGEIIADTRRALLAILAERRKAKASGADYPAICAAIVGKVRAMLAEIAEARREREALASGNGMGRDSWCAFYPSPELRAAFNDGAGESVL